MTFRFNAVAATYLRVTLTGVGVLHIVDIVVDAVPKSSFHHVPAHGSPAAATTSLQSETAGMFETFGARRCVGTKAPARANSPAVFGWQSYSAVWQQVESLAFGFASLFASPRATPAAAAPCGHPLASAYWRAHFPQMAGPLGPWHCDVCRSVFQADTASHRYRCTGGCDFDVCGTCLGKGDEADPRPTVAICGPNGPDWVVAWLAAIQLGIAHVPVDFSCSPDRKAYIIEKSVSNILVCPPATAVALIPLLQDTSCLQHFVVFDTGTAAEITALQQLAAVRGITVSSVRALQDTGAVEVAADASMTRARLWLGVPTDLAGAPISSIIASVLFTSGSTGNPKGATRSFDGIHSLWKKMQFVHPSKVVHGSFQPLSHLAEYTVYVASRMVQAFCRISARLVRSMPAQTLQQRRTLLTCGDALDALDARAVVCGPVPPLCVAG